MRNPCLCKLFLAAFQINRNQLFAKSKPEILGPHDIQGVPEQFQVGTRFTMPCNDKLGISEERKGGDFPKGYFGEVESQGKHKTIEGAISHSPVPKRNYQDILRWTKETRHPIEDISELGKWQRSPSDTTVWFNPPLVSPPYGRTHLDSQRERHLCIRNGVSISREKYPPLCTLPV